MEKVWFKSYPKDVPTSVDTKRHNSIIELIENTFKKYRNKAAFICMGKSYTYFEIDKLSLKFASYLQNNLRLKKGSAVAVMMPNILQYPIVAYGIIRAGMVVVNVNPLYTARELEHQLKDSGSETIIIFESACHTLEKCIKNTHVKNVITTNIGDFLDFPKSLIVNSVIKYVKKMIPKWKIENAVSLKSKLFYSNENIYKAPDIKEDDTAFLQYTGGTTGVSKGAELTHKNIISNTMQINSWIKNIYKSDGVAISPLPIYHIFSMTACCFALFELGITNVIITNPRDINELIKEMDKYKFSVITGVNTLFNAIADNPNFKNLDFSNLCLTLGGGAAIQKDVSDKWKNITKMPIIEAYGLTETSPAVCINPIDNKDHNGTVGLPLPETDIVIKDSNGKNMPINEIGEICVKGPQVMKGYWNRPDETKKIMTDDNYLMTGDIGYIDENGFLKIADRKKDMIIVSGFNIFPNEIEAIVSTHKKVVECAAIGIKDDKTGEAIKVFAVLNDDSLTKEELISHCRDNLTGYKVPKHFEFVKELPKSNVGKILRKKLR